MIRLATVENPSTRGVHRPIEPWKGSRYMELPKFVMDKKAVINIKNNDNQCFKLAVTRALNPVEMDPCRVTKSLKQQAEELGWTGVSFPIPINGPDIRTFEENNNVNVVIIGFDTTFSFENRIKEFFHPLRFPSGPERSRVVRLVVLQKSDKGSTWDEPIVMSQYCVINSLSRLLSSQITKHQHAHNYICNYSFTILTL